MKTIEERAWRAKEDWARALVRTRRAAQAIHDSRFLIVSSRGVLARPNGPLRGSSDAAPTIEVGQPVRRIDRADIGVVVGLLFGTQDKLIVRWVDEVTFEPAENLVEVGQPAA
jgi:hypothetical protein